MGPDKPVPGFSVDSHYILFCDSNPTLVQHLLVPREFFLHPDPHLDAHLIIFIKYNVLLGGGGAHL